MSSEPNTSSQAPDESGEKELCVSCMFPNEPETHFCVKCGAPLTSYAATGPFESLFAEGHVYRQAAERPQRVIVVLGIWIIFGSLASAGIVLVAIGKMSGIGFTAWGAALIALSVLMISKTTANYFRLLRRSDQSSDTDLTSEESASPPSDESPPSA